ncbi:Hypothetical predicted protein [Podarcis lilfordi]|uniref:Uncharacterized protein n=1 Tax=Podarcis lilfordi TaxID=74358 RepID=A0AA35KAN4_9SAUR|nr:Hypothetical predicted protein [Podarcis lilfordi]
MKHTSECLEGPKGGPFTPQRTNGSFQQMNRPRLLPGVGGRDICIRLMTNEVRVRSSPEVLSTKRERTALTLVVYVSF